MTRVAYLGPEGTFAHQALAQLRTVPAPVDGVAKPTVSDVIDAVEEGDADYGVVPFENSVEGQVNLTVDALVHGSGAVQVCEELVLAVTFGAYRRPDDHAPPQAVASHPVALAQCRTWVHGLGVPPRETSSTADACRSVAEGTEPGVLAVASPTAAARWGLEPVAEGIEDFPGAETRFVVAGRHGSPPTGSDRTMLVLVPPDDKAGVLLTALQHISGRGINLSVIASRPLRVRLGEYCFLFVVDIHRDDADCAAAFDALTADGYTIKVLGTYPQSSGRRG
ncbi:MAG: prephenate dehydratase [Acidimicrobiales bacterium]